MAYVHKTCLLKISIIRYVINKTVRDSPSSRCRPSRRATSLFYNRSRGRWMFRLTLCEESTPRSTYLPLNRNGGASSGKMSCTCTRVPRCATRWVLKQRGGGEERECTPWRVCTYYVTSNPTHPSYDVDVGAQTFPDVRHSSVWTRACGKTRWCTHVYITYIHIATRTVGKYRHARSRSRISRVVSRDGRVASAARLTWPPGWHVALTLSEICAGRYLSSWRFRPGCRAKRHLFPFFTPYKKIS